MPPATCDCSGALVGPDGSGLSGETISAKAIRGNGSAGQAVSRRVLTETTGVGGAFTFTLIRLVRYLVWIGDDKANGIQYDVPDAATDDIPEIIGAP